MLSSELSKWRSCHASFSTFVICRLVMPESLITLQKFERCSVFDVLGYGTMVSPWLIWLLLNASCSLKSDQ